MFRSLLTVAFTVLCASVAGAQTSIAERAREHVVRDAAAMAIESPAPASATSGTTKVLLGTWLALSAADAATTYVALGQGARELNPLLNRHSWALPASKIAMAGSAWYLVSKFERSHPTLVRWITVAGAVGYGAIVYHNVQVIQQQRAINQR